MPDLFLMAPVVPHECGLVGWFVQVYLLQQDGWPIRCASAVGIFNVGSCLEVIFVEDGLLGN